MSNLKLFKEQDIDYGIFGDIDLEEYKQWEDKVCEKAFIEAILPLWKRNRKEIVQGQKNLPAINLYFKNGYQKIKDIKISKDVYLTKFEKTI